MDPLIYSNGGTTTITMHGTGGSYKNLDLSAITDFSGKKITSIRVYYFQQNFTGTWKFQFTGAATWQQDYATNVAPFGVLNAWTFTTLNVDIDVGDVSADGLIFGAFNTINGYFRGTSSSPYNPNLEIRGVDAAPDPVEESVGHTINVLLLDRSTANHTINALLGERLSATHTLSALLRQTVPVLHTIGSTLKSRLAAYHTLNAYLKRTSSAAHTLSALLRKNTSAVHTVGTLLATRLLRSHTLSALLKKSPTASHTASALLLKSTTATHTLDAFLEGDITNPYTRPTSPYSRSTRPYTPGASPYSKPPRA